MEVKQNIKIHNRFDVFSRNINTGVETQTGWGENILLDQIYTRLCGGSSYFANINFGTGTGAPSATRTSLFTHLGTKTAVNEELVKAIPISSWKRKIVLNPEEYVGQTITEVGIARGSASSYLMTHAMIKDAEGNPISITKTDTEVVTIYATVYVTFDTSIDIDWLGVNNNTNTLMNYLIGGSSAPTGSFGLLPIPFAFARLGSTPSATWTADVANKKRKTNIPRFDINTANGNALALEFSNIFQLRFPATGIHAGRAYTNVPLGVGNGATRTFAMPSQNLKSGTLTVKADGVATTAFTLAEKSMFNDYATPPNMPADGRSVALSSDGTVLAVATYQSPYIKIYDWSNGWTERATPPNMPADGQSVALSLDGTVLAVATGSASPYIKIYDSQYITQADIIFDTVPAEEAVLTVDYTVKGVHKTTNQVIDASFAIQFGEGV